MSYASRVYRHRNPKINDEQGKEPFFSKKNDTNKTGQKSSFFQAKHSVNEPGDKYEYEADTVANAVVNNKMSSPVLQEKNLSSIQLLSSPINIDTKKEIQKMEDPLKEEKDKKEPSAVQRKQDTSSNAAPTKVSSMIEGSVGKGTSLPKNILHEMNSSFGADFSDVKVHDDSEAVTMNNELQAQAFTHGSDIYFNKGKYQPENDEGKFLLAHELTHVVQQNPLNSLHKKEVDTQQDTEKKYNIVIKKGDKDWTAGELELLYSALRLLSKPEASVLRNYQFIRWSSKSSRASLDPSYVDVGVDECGLHEADLANGVFKISLYDACFSDPEAVSDKTADIDTGQFHILHEIGHAMQQGELRNTNETQKAANKKYNELVGKYNKAGEGDRKKMKPGIRKLDKASDEAVNAMIHSEGRSLKDFEKLIKESATLSEYSKTSAEEAFAEAFAFYKADPQGLKKSNPKLFNWFKRGGFLKPLRKK